MKRFITYWILLLFILPGSFLGEPLFAQSYSRPENNVWLNGGYVGEGIDFNSGIPQPVFSSWQSHSLHMGSASVCDMDGNLLFYTDGNIVWDKNHQVMINGWDINNNGDLAPYTTFIDPTFGLSSHNFDGVVIIPMPGSSHKYYIFSSPSLYTRSYLNGRYVYLLNWNGKLYGTVVDMELNNGLGAVDPSFRGIQLADSMAGNLHAVIGENCNYWLLGFGSNGRYKAYEVTAAGFDSNPVISVLTPPLNPQVSEFNLSPDRRKAAMAYGSEVQVSDFDPATGIFSNDVLIGAQEARFLAFSPNSQYLYVSGLIGIRQYDLNALTNPFNLLTFNNITAYEKDAPLRLGPDGKIYLSYCTTSPITGGVTVGGQISQPDIFGPGCQMELIQGSSIPLLENDWYIDYAFPNEVPVVIYDTVSKVQEVALCFQEPELLEPVSEGGTDYHWFVNTVGTAYVREGSETTSSVLADAPGIYAVQYFTSNPCTFHQDTFIVKSVNYSLYLGSDQLSCEGDPVELDSDVSDAEYLWSTGGTEQKIIADSSGRYWVEVTKDGCSARDTVFVRLLNMKQNLGEDTLLCLEENNPIRLIANVPEGALAFWSTGNTADEIRIHEGGTYWVEVTIGDCLAADTIRIDELYCDCPMLMPNAFSPNGDGINDQFKPSIPHACPVSGYRMQIYNRWGQMIFVGYRPDDGWDGSYNGEPAAAGSYYYQVSLDMGLRQIETVRSGEFMLLR